VARDAFREGRAFQQRARPQDQRSLGSHGGRLLGRL
jgi:hypothetical protein